MIGMHNLWREFEKLETKVSEIEKRRWMFEWDEHNVLEEARVMLGVRRGTSGGCFSRNRAL